MKAKIKQFWQKHRKKFLIGAGITGAFLLGMFVRVSKEKGITLEEGPFDMYDCLRSSLEDNKFVKEKLDPPDWGDDYNITGYFQEKDFLRGMLVDIPINTLCGSEFGDRLINDCGANPDLFADILIEYNSNE